GSCLAGQQTSLRVPCLFMVWLFGPRHWPPPSALVVASRPNPPAVVTSFSPSTTSKGVAGYAARTLATVARLKRSGIPSGLPLDHCLVASSSNPKRKRYFPRFITHLIS